MNAQLFKVIRRTPDVESTLGLFVPGSNLNHYLAHGGPLVSAMMTEPLHAARDALLKQARDYLRESNRELHLLNLYLDWDGNNREVTATYTFDDRTAALLFKLSAS